MERRNHSNIDEIPAALPIDYLKMVKSVFTSNFQKGLLQFSKLKKNPYFEAKGAIFPNEVCLSVTLLSEGKLSAHTIHASCDFNPNKKPTAEELLSACVDALGEVYAGFLLSDDPSRLEDLAQSSLSSMKNVSHKWELIEINKQKVFIKMDKSNPYLDAMADDWIKTNAKTHPKVTPTNDDTSNDESDS